MNVYLPTSVPVPHGPGRIIPHLDNLAAALRGQPLPGEAQLTPVQQMLTETADVSTWDRPRLVIPKVQTRDVTDVLPWMPKSIAELGAGVQRGVAGALDFFLSPLGVATLGTAGMPMQAQRAVSATFTFDMAAKSPEIVQALGDAWQRGDLGAVAEHATGLGLNSAFIYKGAEHATGLKPVKATPQQRTQRTEGAEETQTAGGEFGGEAQPGISAALEKDLAAAEKTEPLDFSAGNAPVKGGANAVQELGTGRVSETPASEGVSQVGGQVRPAQERAETGVGSETETEVGTVKPFVASTPIEGRQVSGDWEVVEAGDLMTSFDRGYPPGLQPRDRGRAASENQLAQIKAGLEPQRLGDSPTTDVGAPVVDAEDNVLSGNNRVRALRELYQAEGNPGQAYKDWLEGVAEQFGARSEDVRGFSEPVLVRRVRDYGGLTKEEFARQSNQSQVLGMSEGEKAAADARMLVSNPALMASFKPGEDGNVLAGSNRDFLQAFVQGTGDTAELRTKEGLNGPVVAKRVKNAMLGAFLGPEEPGLLAALIEGQEGFKNVVNGLLTAAPDLARLRGTAWDLAPVARQALRDLIGIRQRGEKVQDFLSQRPLLEEAGRTAESDAVLKALAEATSGKQVAEMLDRYAKGGQEALTDAQSGGLLGQTPATRGEIAARAFGETGKTKGLIRGTAAETWADRVIAEGRQRMSAGLDPEQLAAYAVKGAALLEQGIRDAAEWGRQMVQEFGEAVRPYLDQVRKAADDRLQMAENRPGEFLEGKVAEVTRIPGGQFVAPTIGLSRKLADEWAEANVRGTRPERPCPNCSVHPPPDPHHLAPSPRIRLRHPPSLLKSRAR